MLPFAIIDTLQALMQKSSTMTGEVCQCPFHRRATSLSEKCWTQFSVQRLVESATYCSTIAKCSVVIYVNSSVLVLSFVLADSLLYPCWRFQQVVEILRVKVQSTSSMSWATSGMHRPLCIVHRLPYFMLRPSNSMHRLAGGEKSSS